MAFEILGSATATPDQRVLSQEWDARLGLPLGTLERKTGVVSRTVAASGETARVLAHRAAVEALAAAGIAANAVDLVIGACGVPLRPLPSTSSIVAHDLGLRDGWVEAVDVNTTCLSFLGALSLALLRMQAGRNHCVLIVGADTPSRALPWTTAPETAALFGDGAAALVLMATPGWTLVRERQETHPSAAFACTLAAGGSELDYHGDPEGFAAGSFFAMNGPALFRATHKALPGFLRTLCGDAYGVDTWAAAAIHQGSPGALDHIGRLIPLDGDRMPRFGHIEGNQVAASLPGALHRILSGRSFARGERLALLGAGAGLHVGGMVWERTA